MGRSPGRIRWMAVGWGTRTSRTESLQDFDISWVGAPLFEL